MKSAPSTNSTKENCVTRTIERGQKRLPLEAIRNNIAASYMIDFKRIGPIVKNYLKSANDAGIVNEVTGKAVAGFYMVNVSLEKRVFIIGNKKRIRKVKKQRHKVNKSSFDRRTNRSGNDLLYI